MDIIGITTFIFRISTSVFILGISYQSWYIFNKIPRSKLADIASKIAIIFLTFGTIRLLMAFPDIYLKGLFSNLTNNVMFGWFFYILFKTNRQLRRKSTDDRKLSKKIDDVINELTTNYKYNK